MILFSFFVFVGVVVVICCCILRIVFISWQTVVCLLNSTALSPGEEGDSQPGLSQISVGFVDDI